jgi:anti-sigma B factor antagonist
MKKPEHGLLQNLIAEGLRSVAPREVAAMNDLPEFNLSSSRIGPQALRLRIDGELDLYNAPAVQEELSAIPSDIRFVLTDLTRLSFMDSAGMAALLETAQRLSRRRGTMMLVFGNASVLRALEVSGLDRYFEIRDDYDSAARELAGRTFH